MDTAVSKPTIVIKPLGGIAGDMFAGACGALWSDLRETCLADVRDAGLPDAVACDFEEVSVNGFAAHKFRVGEADAVVPTGDYGMIVTRLSESALDRPVLAIALEILRILGEAEARVHGKPLEKVHFHELADWDSIADVVAAASFVARAPASDWQTTQMPMGGSSINTQHGRITVPAPAVLEILKGYDFIDDGVAGERVTPTGAAILRYLTEPGRREPVRGRLAGSGFGAGDKRFPGLANVLQLVAFEPITEAAEEVVTEIAFDIDDMTPEEIGVATDRLRATQGVLDVTQTAQIGKKGRAIFLIRVLCSRPAAEVVADACFHETSTLGLRIGDVRRRVLSRRMAATPGGTVKVSTRPGGAETAKVDSDDLAGTETLDARRRQARRSEHEAIGLETSDG